MACHSSRRHQPGVTCRRNPKRLFQPDKEAPHHLKPIEISSSHKTTPQRRTNHDVVLDMKIIHRRRVTIAGQQVTEQDWRGILAVVTTLGYFVVISVATLRYGADEALAVIG